MQSNGSPQAIGLRVVQYSASTLPTLPLLLRIAPKSILIVQVELPPPSSPHKIQGASSAGLPGIDTCLPGRAVWHRRMGDEPKTVVAERVLTGTESSEGPQKGRNLRRGTKEEHEVCPTPLAQTNRPTLDVEASWRERERAGYVELEKGAKEKDEHAAKGKGGGVRTTCTATTETRSRSPSHY
ncbi:hypothetical protein B0H12DRAFT_1238175 [Mycena haematopus]|nr:hypothetical protein B0H12DRAFT_1238175 [Mycena haematopus]